MPICLNYKFVLNGTLQIQDTRPLLAQVVDALGGVKAVAYLFRVSHFLVYKWIESAAHSQGRRNPLERTAVILNELVTSGSKGLAIRIANYFNDILGGYFVSKEALEGIEEFVKEAKGGNG